jgi:chemotaxis response regulator CheB
MKEGPLAEKTDRTDRTIRVVLADSSRLTAMGISQVIEKEPEMELVATASDGEEAVTKTLELEPDVLVIEADLPRLSGIKVTQRIRRELVLRREIGVGRLERREHLDAAARLPL